jgi:hypothetical protein
MLNLLVVLVVTIFISFLIETLVEYLFAPYFNNIQKLTPYKWLQMYIAMAIGLVASFIYQLDLVNLLSRYLSVISGVDQVIPVTTFGYIVTGAAIGRGSNYLHDLVKKFFAKSAITDLSPLDPTE